MSITTALGCALALMVLFYVFMSVMMFLGGFVFGLLKRIDRWLDYDEDDEVYIAVIEIGEFEYKP